jgi:DNA processing protein
MTTSVPEPAPVAWEVSASASGSASGSASVGAGAADDVRLARAYLSRVAEPPAPALATAGPVEAARLVRAGDVSAEVGAETGSRRGVDHAEADLVAAAAVGARLVVPEDEEWPHWQLAALTLAGRRHADWAVPPLALWARGPGRLDELTSGGIAVVGSRAATGYGEHVAIDLGHELADRGHPVISGAAYGIDGAAHRGALAAVGPTVAVLACGVDRCYPSGHTELLRRIVEHGTVVSEYAPGTSPARHRFLVRNRLIAALSDGTVVVEAGLRSGARNTATTARELGRVVMAVPGPVTSAMSRGTNQLIRDGVAVAVTGAADVLDSAGRFGGGQDAPAVRRGTDGLDRADLWVHEALSPRADRSAEWLARESGVPLDRVRAALPLLELRGLARRTELGWRLAGHRAARGVSARGGA